MSQKTNNQIYKALEDHKAEDRIVQANLATKEDLQELKVMIAELTERTDNMQPVLEFLATMNSINKFLKWGGITFFAFIAFIWFMIKR